MKPWADPKTIARFRKMSGAKSLRLGGELVEAALELLRDSIKTQRPRWSARRRRDELKRLLHRQV